MNTDANTPTPAEALPDDVRAKAERIQRNMPTLAWEVCVTLAQLEIANAARRPAAPRRGQRDEGADLEYLQHRNRTLHGRRHWAR